MSIGQTDDCHIFHSTQETEGFNDRNESGFSGSLCNITNIKNVIQYLTKTGASTPVQSTTFPTNESKGESINKQNIILKGKFIYERDKVKEHCKRLVHYENLRRKRLDSMANKKETQHCQHGSENENYLHLLINGIVQSPTIGGFCFVDPTGILYCEVPFIHECDLHVEVILSEWVIVPLVNQNSDLKFYLLRIEQYFPVNIIPETINSFNLILDLDLTTEKYIHSLYTWYHHEESSPSMTVSAHKAGSDINIIGTLVSKSVLRSFSKASYFYAEIHCPIFAQFNGRFQEKILAAWIVYYGNPVLHDELVKCFQLLHIGQVYQFEKLSTGRIKLECHSIPKDNPYYHRKLFKFEFGKSSFYPSLNKPSYEFLFSTIEDRQESLQSAFGTLVANFYPVTITKIIDQASGIFEVNTKYKLYTHFHHFWNSITGLSVGTVVKLYHTHLIKIRFSEALDSMDNRESSENCVIALAICDYSFIEVVKPSNVHPQFFVNREKLNDYRRQTSNFNIADLLVLDYLKDYLHHNVGIEPELVSNLLQIFGHYPYSHDNPSLMIDHQSCSITSLRYAVPLLRTVADIQAKLRMASLKSKQSHRYPKPLCSESHLIFESNEYFPNNNENVHFFIGYIEINDYGQLEFRNLIDRETVWLTIRRSIYNGDKNQSIQPTKMEPIQTQLTKCAGSPLLVLISNFTVVQELLDDSEFPRKLTYLSLDAKDIHPIPHLSTSPSVIQNWYPKGDNLLLFISHVSSRKLDLQQWIDTKEIYFTSYISGIAYHVNIGTGNMIEQIHEVKYITCILPHEASPIVNLCSPGQFAIVKSFTHIGVSESLNDKKRSSSSDAVDWAVLISDIKDVEFVNISIEDSKPFTTLSLSRDPKLSEVVFEYIKRQSDYLVSHDVSSILGLSSAADKFNTIGYFNDCVNLRGKIISRKMIDVDFLISDMFENVEDLNRVHFIGYGRQDKILSIRISCLLQPLKTIDVYMDLRYQEYPLGLIIGSVVELWKLTLKRSKKKDSIYCIFAAGSRVSFCELRSPSSARSCEIENSQTTNSEPFSTKFVPLSSFFNSLDKSKIYRFACRVNFVQEVSFWLSCVVCSKVFNFCACQTESKFDRKGELSSESSSLNDSDGSETNSECHSEYSNQNRRRSTGNKTNVHGFNGTNETPGMIIRGNAVIHVYDGSSEATIYLDEVEDVWNLILKEKSSVLKAHIEEYVMAAGSLKYHNDPPWFSNNYMDVSNLRNTQNHTTGMESQNDSLNLNRASCTYQKLTQIMYQFQHLCASEDLISARRLVLTYLETKEPCRISDGKTVTSFQYPLESLKIRNIKISNNEKKKLKTISHGRLILSCCQLQDQSIVNACQNLLDLLTL